MVIETALGLGIVLYLYFVLNSDPVSRHRMSEKYEKTLGELKNNIRFPHQIWERK